MEPCTQLDIQQLPQSWIHHFIELLPSHLKLTLRQCSCSMLKLIDSHPSSCLAWQVIASRKDTDIRFDSRRTSLALFAPNVVHLDVSKLPFLGEVTFTSEVILARAEQLRSKPVFSRLRKLTMRADQWAILGAVESNTAARSLEQLLLWCCHACADPEASYTVPCNATVLGPLQDFAGEHTHQPALDCKACR